MTHNKIDEGRQQEGVDSKAKVGRKSTTANGNGSGRAGKGDNDDGAERCCSRLLQDFPAFSSARTTVANEKEAKENKDATTSEELSRPNQRMILDFPALSSARKPVADDKKAKENKDTTTSDGRSKDNRRRSLPDFPTLSSARKTVADDRTAKANNNNTMMSDGGNKPCRRMTLDFLPLASTRKPADHKKMKKNKDAATRDGRSRLYRRISLDFSALSSTRKTVANDKKAKENKDAMTSDGRSRPRRRMSLFQRQSKNFKKDPANTDSEEVEDLMRQFGNGEVNEANRRHATTNGNEMKEKKMKWGTVALHARGMFTSSSSGGIGDGGLTSQKSRTHHERIQTGHTESPASLKANKTNLALAKANSDKVVRLDEAQAALAQPPKDMTQTDTKESTLTLVSGQISHTTMATNHSSKNQCGDKKPPQETQAHGGLECNVQPQQSHVREEEDSSTKFARDFLAAAPCPESSSPHDGKNNPQGQRSSFTTTMMKCHELIILSLSSRSVDDDDGSNNENYSHLRSGCGTDEMAREAKHICPLEIPLKHDVLHQLRDIRDGDIEGFPPAEQMYRSLPSLSDYIKPSNQLWHRQGGWRKKSQSSSQQKSNHKAAERVSNVVASQDASKAETSNEEEAPAQSPAKNPSQSGVQAQAHAQEGEEDQDPKQTQYQWHPKRRTRHKSAPPSIRERGEGGRRRFPREHEIWRRHPEQISFKLQQQASMKSDEVSCLGLGDSASNNGFFGEEGEEGAGKGEMVNAAAASEEEIARVEAALAEAAAAVASAQLIVKSWESRQV